MDNFPDVTVGKQLIVGEGNPFALGVGQAQIRGSSYIEGPSIFGDPGPFPFLQGTVMIGPAKIAICSHRHSFRCSMLWTCI